MAEVTSFCRRCEGFCGVVATVDSGRVVDLRGDPDNPISEGHLCEAGRASIAALDHPDRIRTPLRRDGSRWIATTWDEALADIGSRLRKIRRSAGARAVAVHAGAPVGMSSRDSHAMLAFVLAMGTPNLFTSWAQVTSPWIRAAELVVGHPVALQADVARSSYTILLGGNQLASQWGPLMGGTTHAASIATMRREYKGKLAVVDPRRTELAATADVHVAVRPGTDLFFVLGVLNAVVGSKWVDRQYVGDYCRNFDELAAAVAPWTPDRCAAICGVDKGEIAGVALKFARAPTGTIKPGRGALMSGYGTLTSWASMALAAVTANLLRPGGLFDNTGLLDVVPMLRALGTDQAPQARVSGIRSVLMQLPSSLLADEVLTPGEGQVKALVSLSGDPVHSTGPRERVERALSDLDLLVCVEAYHNATTARAHWVLPTVEPWERADTHVHDTFLFVKRFSQHTEAVVPPPEQARTLRELLPALLKASRPPWSGSAWGRHLVALGRWASSADLDTWERRAWDLLVDTDLDEVRKAPHGLSLGEVSRANWRIGHEDGRIDLLPEAIRDALGALDPAELAPSALVLGSRSRDAGAADVTAVSPAGPVVEVHPDTAAALGLSAGQQVELRSASGSLAAVVALEPSLRPDTVIVPFGWGTAVDLGGRSGGAADLTSRPVDPLTGAPGLAGSEVTIRALGDGREGRPGSGAGRGVGTD